MTKAIYVKSEVQRLIFQIEDEYEKGLLPEIIYDNQMMLYRTIEYFFDNNFNLSDINIEEGYMFYIINSTNKNYELMDSMNKVIKLVKKIQLEEKIHFFISVLVWPISFIILILFNSRVHLLQGYLWVMGATCILLIMLIYDLLYQKIVRSIRLLGAYGYIGRYSLGIARVALFTLVYESIMLIKYFPW